MLLKDNINKIIALLRPDWSNLIPGLIIAIVTVLLTIILTFFFPDVKPSILPADLPGVNEKNTSDFDGESSIWNGIIIEDLTERIISLERKILILQSQEAIENAIEKEEKERNSTKFDEPIAAIVKETDLVIKRETFQTGDANYMFLIIKKARKIPGITLAQNKKLLLTSIELGRKYCEYIDNEAKNMRGQHLLDNLWSITGNDIIVHHNPDCYRRAKELRDSLEQMNEHDLKGLTSKP